jgi:metal-responsive CopG/Arc/MetJ family transcriptional regulator
MRKKATIAISIDPNLLVWIDSQIKIKRFAHRSHAFELGIQRLKEEYEKKK